MSGANERSPRSEVADNTFFVDRNEPTNDEVDLPKIEAAVRNILAAVGEDPDREGLLETPARVARMYAEMFAGLKSDPSRHLAKVFAEEYDEIVLVRDISFCSMCEHHLLPFMGHAHIGYIPDGRVLGLSKLARVVEDGVALAVPLGARAVAAAQAAQPLRAEHGRQALGSEQ